MQTTLDFSKMEIHELKTELSRRVHDLIEPINTDGMTAKERDKAIAIMDQIEDEEMELRIRIGFRESQIAKAGGNGNADDDRL